MEDKEIIVKFIEQLNRANDSSVKIDSFPDIDAIAGKYAIEHTSIDTIKNQRRDSDWFMKVIEGLEKKFSSTLDYRLNITFPWDSVKPGQDWPIIRSSLYKWILKESPNCADGHCWVEDIQNIPFKFFIRKSSDRTPGLFFARFEPEDDSLSDRLSIQLQRKIKKLSLYKEQGKETILIVDSNDIALMNQWRMTEAVFTAFSEGFPKGLDQIWYADTTLPNNLIFDNITDTVKNNIKNT